MRTVLIGDKEVRVKATPLALYYYKKEFKADIVGDLIKVSEAEKDPSKMDTVALLQITWAMNKTAEMRKDFPGFEKWLEGFDYVDILDDNFIEKVTEEAEEGFFRGGGGRDESE